MLIPFVTSFSLFATFVISLYLIPYESHSIADSSGSDGMSNNVAPRLHKLLQRYTWNQHCFSCPCHLRLALYDARRIHTIPIMTTKKLTISTKGKSDATPVGMSIDKGGTP